MLARRNQYINKAYDCLKTASMDNKKRYEYEAREKAIRDHNTLMREAIEQGLEQGLQQGLQQGLEQGLEQGLQQGLQQGLEQGKKQMALEMARKLLKSDLSIENIAEYSGVSIEEIKEMGDRI